MIGDHRRGFDQRCAINPTPDELPTHTMFVVMPFDPRSVLYELERVTT